jgi:hypothetical protein
MPDGLKCLLARGDELRAVRRQAQLVQPEYSTGDAPHVVVELPELIGAHVRRQSAGKIPRSLVEAVTEQLEGRLRVVQLGEQVHATRILRQLVCDLRSGKRVRSDGASEDDYPLVRH